MYRIYFAERPGITTSDNSTLRYGGAKNNGDAIYNIDVFGFSPRYILVRGLNDSTTYYYRIYDCDDADWASDEGIFTTTSRFTTVWDDLFFDDYLIEANNSMEITYYTPEYADKQNQLMNSTDFYYPSFIIEDGVWHTYSTEGNVKFVYYWNSTNGTSWANKTAIPSLAGGTRIFGNIVKDEGKYKFISVGDDDVYGISVKECSTPNGAFTTPTGVSNPVIDDDDMGNVYTSDEFHLSGVCNDSLGANKWYATGQQNLNNPAPNMREGGFYIGLNDSYWLAFDELIDIDYRRTAASPYRQYYVMPTMQFSGYYVGLLCLYNNTNWGEGVTCTDNETMDALSKLQIVVSRNGYNDWTAVRELEYTEGQLIINTNWANCPPSLNWQNGWVNGFWGNFFINLGDYDYLYYYREPNRHNCDACGVGCAVSGYSVCCRTRFRHDGFAYIKPNGSTGWFRTITIPGQFVDNFTINGNFSNTAKLNISIMNANTSTIYSGFDYSDFDTITTNSTNITPTWSGKTLSQIPEGDFKINFSFDGVGSGELYGYELWEGQHEETPQFIAIENSTNGTSFYNSRPMLNWTILSSASQYWLQISNTSAFNPGDIVINITDINIYNYPGSCSQNSTRMSFVLPVEYALPVPKKYYTWVYAYIR